MDNYSDMTDVINKNKDSYLDLLIRIYEGDTSWAAQGQGMDGYSKLHNYEILAKMVKEAKERRYIG